MFRLSTTLTAALLPALLTTAHADLSVENAWVRAGPPRAAALAGYMTIQNTSAQDVTLVGANSPQFLRVEMHRTEISPNGMARMEMIKERTIKAGSELTFEPTGNHFMLIKPSQRLVPGDRVVIDLLLSDGKSRPVEATVRSE